MCITDYSTDGKQHSQHMEESKDFPTSCKHRFPQLHKTASYTHSHNACCCEIHPILSYLHKETKENKRKKKREYSHRKKKRSLYSIFVFQKVSKINTFLCFFQAWGGIGQILLPMSFQLCRAEKIHCFQPFSTPFLLLFVR